MTASYIDKQLVKDTLMTAKSLGVK